MITIFGVYELGLRATGCGYIYMIALIDGLYDVDEMS
jgi:hypothetical protein